MIELIAGVLALLDLLIHWRVMLCFVASGGVAMWLLFNVDRPWGVVGFFAVLALGLAIGLGWQRRHSQNSGLQRASSTR